MKIKRPDKIMPGFAVSHVSSSPFAAISAPFSMKETSLIIIKGDANSKLAAIQLNMN